VRIEKAGLEIRSVDDWFKLAPPKGGREHWVEHRSALECARAWLPGSEGPQCPSELVDLFASHPDPWVDRSSGDARASGSFRQAPR
jgi:hypothetical protein